MKITKLILHNYKRFFLNNITHLEYTPQSHMQIILGQNGSGKSSLLYQLTPLPANIKKDFNQDGYKEIFIEHNNKHYHLISGVNGTNKHSFLVDDIELNESGTSKIQQQLVEEHFNITPHLQQVLFGLNKFTQMSPSERKKWLTEISNIDYSYPINVYNNLKSRHRDIIGAIKLQQTDLVKLEKSKVSKEQVKHLENEKQHYINLIDHLLTLITTKQVNESIEDKIEEIKSIVNKLNTTEHQYRKDDIEYYKNELVKLRTQYKYIKDELENLNKKLSEVKDLDIIKNKESILNKIKEITEAKNNILNNSKFKQFKYLEDTCLYFKNSYTDIVSLLNEIYSLGNVNIKNTHVKTLESTINQLKLKLDTLKKHEIQAEEQLNHIKTHQHEDNQVTCPKCNHRWNPQLEGLDKVKIEQYLSKVREHIVKLSNTLKDKETELEIINNVKSLLSHFVRYMKYNEDTIAVFEYIKTLPAYEENGYYALPTLFESIYQEVSRLCKIVDYDKELNELKQKYDIILEKEKTLHTLQDSKDKLEQAIINKQEQLLKLNKDITTIEYKLTKAEQFQSEIQNLKNKLQNLYKLKQDIIESELNIKLKEAVSELRVKVIEIDNQLKEYYDYDAKIVSLQQTLDELNKKEKVLRIMCEVLSPSTGLIAKSIESFINAFISDMNYLISHIWGYDMEILGCDIVEGNLDYKFKVKVNNDEIIEDVSKTSSGMKEIIDLVFLITFSKYAGFINYPLILDEFGKTLDAQHRISAYDAIERLIAQDFSQVFIVSHFESMYGRFGNADISVLGTQGVELSTIDNYNQVMKIS